MNKTEFQNFLNSTRDTFLENGWGFAVSAMNQAEETFNTAQHAIQYQAEFFPCETAEQLNEMLDDKGMTVFAAFEGALNDFWQQYPEQWPENFNEAMSLCKNMHVDAKCALEDSVPMSHKLSIGFCPLTVANIETLIAECEHDQTILTVSVPAQCALDKGWVLTENDNDFKVDDYTLHIQVRGDGATYWHCENSDKSSVWDIQQTGDDEMVIEDIAEWAENHQLIDFDANF